MLVRGLLDCVDRGRRLTRDGCGVRGPVGEGDERRAMSGLHGDLHDQRTRLRKVGEKDAGGTRCL